MPIKWIIVIIASSLLLTGCGDHKLRKPLVTASLADMVHVPGGSYRMGSDKLSGMSAPVTVTSFYISKDNVDYKKYDLFSKSSGKKLLNQDGIKYHFFERAPNYPVNYISWYQSNDYCQYLAKITGLPYDLPTQTQWEYVARNNGKLNWDFPTNNGKQELGKNFPSFKQLINQKGNVAKEPIPLPTGSIPCTPQGVCGLTGAVNEWTKDSEGDKKVIRGAGADSSPEVANAYNTTLMEPSDAVGGFRCVINSDKPMSELQQIAAQHLQ
jgi:formylglycine-generating enzyme required for sulfatase activity